MNQQFLKYLVYNIHAIDTEKHNLNNIKLLNGTDAKNIYSNSMIISCLFSSNICTAHTHTMAKGPSNKNFCHSTSFSIL